MQFASDNWAGAAPPIVDAISREAASFADPYGVSALDRAVAARFNEIFEREVAVFFVGTGTAANALALASVNRPGGAVFCHRESHVVEDECGAVEFQTGGARVMSLNGPAGKIDPDNLDEALRRFRPGFVHAGQPMAASITQATEAGTVYSIGEVGRLAGIARRHGIPLHMDGSRFVNALVHLDASPADLTWRAGVDILSFGGTKNGCVMAEALVVFDPGRAADLPYMRKRAGHLLSKTRFIAAQFDAYLRDDLWLALGRQANSMADRLRAGIARAGFAARLAWPTQTNEVFAILEGAAAARLEEAGARFYDWPRPHGVDLETAPGERLVRLVTSYATSEADVDRFLDALSG